MDKDSFIQLLLHMLSGGSTPQGNRAPTSQTWEPGSGGPTAGMWSQAHPTIPAIIQRLMQGMSREGMTPDPMSADSLLGLDPGGMVSGMESIIPNYTSRGVEQYPQHDQPSKPAPDEGVPQSSIDQLLNHLIQMAASRIYTPDPKLFPPGGGSTNQGGKPIDLPFGWFPLSRPANQG